MNDEYSELQKLRALWSKAIITREYIFIPLVLGIITASLSQLPNFPFEWISPFLTIEGIMLIIAVIYWRTLTWYTDRDIVRLYGRMLEIEREEGMDIQTQYFYQHLKGKHREKINQEIGLNSDNKNFIKFRQKAKEKNEKKHYELLLGIWNDFGSKSVGTRGHFIHTVVAIVIVATYWILLELWSCCPKLLPILTL